jgi:hypothetical protein
MDGALKNAEQTIKEISSVKLAFVKQSELNSFMAGHVSNINAVFFNEERRIIENVESNFGNGLSLTVIQAQVDELKLNRNILKLSVVAHPRAVYRGEMLRFAQSENINNFKMVIPKNVKLDPAGETIKNLFLIKTLLAWEALNDDRQNGGGVVGGLGLHHNSQDYYYPVSDEELSIQEQISKEQRKNLDAIKK